MLPQLVVSTNMGDLRTTKVDLAELQSLTPRTEHDLQGPRQPDLDSLIRLTDQRVIEAGVSDRKVSKTRVGEVCAAKIRNKSKGGLNREARWLPFRGFALRSSHGLSFTRHALQLEILSIRCTLTVAVVRGEEAG